MTQSVESKINTLEKQVLSLEKDQEVSAGLHSKFDQSMEKLSEATTSIKEMLVAHQHTLLRHEDEYTNIYKIIDENRRDQSIQIQTLMNNFEKSIEKMCFELGTKINDLNNTGKDQDKRIKVLERASWVVVGFGVVIGYLVDKIPFLELFKTI